MKGNGDLLTLKLFLFTTFLLGANGSHHDNKGLPHAVLHTCRFVVIRRPRPLCCVAVTPSSSPLTPVIHRVENKRCLC